MTELPVGQVNVRGLYRGFYVEVDRHGCIFLFVDDAAGDFHERKDTWIGEPEPEQIPHRVQLMTDIAIAAGCTPHDVLRSSRGALA